MFRLLCHVFIGMCAASFEWAGVFESRGQAIWSFEKDGPSYADPSMVVVVIEGTNVLELESVAEDMLSQMCVAVQPGGQISPSSNACYELYFDESHNTSSFEVYLDGPLSIFTAHHPLDYHAKMRLASGEEIGPILERQYAISHVHDFAHTHTAIADDHEHEQNHYHDPIADDHEHSSDSHGHDYAWVAMALAITSIVFSMLNAAVIIIVVLYRCMFHRTFTESLIGIHLPDAS